MTDLDNLDANVRRQYEGVYGEYVSGEHSIGQEITTAHHGGGVILWSYRDPELQALVYVCDNGTGWPIEIKASNVTQS
jgi:hypothetical protein